jgi:preprotein translocase subunit YajC
MIDPAWAQAGPAGGGPSALVNLLPLILIFVVFYFLLIRPQQQKAKEHRTMLDNLKRNDNVVTSGGIYGKVIAITEHVITLEIASNVRIRVERGHISSLAKSGPAEESKEKDKPKS